MRLGVASALLKRFDESQPAGRLIEQVKAESGSQRLQARNNGDDGADLVERYYVSEQPDGFQKSWLSRPLEFDLAAFSFPGRLVPTATWQGHAQDPVLELKGYFDKASFSLCLSLELAQYLLSFLPDPVNLKEALEKDLALLFEHVLTPFLDGLERWTNREVSLVSGQIAPASTVRVGASAILTSESSSFPMMIGSDSAAFWRNLTILNDFRVALTAQWPVKVGLSQISLPTDEVNQLAVGDIIMLDDADGSDLNGDLLIDDDAAYSVRISPGRIVLDQPIEGNPDAPKSDQTSIRFILGTVMMTGWQITRLQHGTEVSGDELWTGSVEIVCNGQTVGNGDLFQEGEQIGIHIVQLSWPK